jgi:hypothetical protein
MQSGRGFDPSHGPPLGLPWQFAFRAVAIITGLALLVIVDVHGAVFYFAWGLIGFALVTEAAATLFYWRRSRGGERS